MSIMPNKASIRKQCNTCWCTAGKKLAFYTACKVARCTEKNDWPPEDPKIICQNNQRCHRTLKFREGISASERGKNILPDGINMIQPNQRLADWLRFHAPRFVGAVHCLNLAANKNDPQTKGVLTKLKPRIRVVHQDNPGMYSNLRTRIPWISKRRLGSCHSGRTS
ncbi:hypothetical protein BXZ70DRAFT_361045 [Cristinia sonorae]|uniref:Uncharacterized protein n=1 Tax=Cristinia sonorae TaxID=1940300 RepID=A0A8K0UJ71_9AGAR|nr:hypothetical protein BXZ70DRAFT_361045 [Cristinia sonorae]